MNPPHDGFGTMTWFDLWTEVTTCQMQTKVLGGTRCFYAPSCTPAICQEKSIPWVASGPRKMWRLWNRLQSNFQTYSYFTAKRVATLPLSTDVRKI